MTYTFSDVYGFAGGFSLGMVQAGFEMKTKAETSTFGFKPTLANRHLLGDGWEPQQAAASRAPDWEIFKTDVVAGNPPCSGFSSLSDKHHKGVGSPVNECMWAFESYVERAQPYIAAFESVQQAYSGGVDLMRQLHAKLRATTGLDYQLYHVKHNGLSVGGAALRPRYFWLVSRVPFGIELDAPERVPTVVDVLGDLGGLRMQWEPQEYAREASWWSESRRNPAGTVDGQITKNTIHAKRINDLVDVVGHWPPGADETAMIKQAYELLGNKLPESFDRISDKIHRYGIAQGFRNTRRWRPTRPAYVVTGAAADLIFHPTENRLLTYREIFRVQGFPDNWNLAPLEGDSKIGEYPGKGIPVDCGRWIGGWMKNALDGNPGSFKGEQLGENEYLIEAGKQHKDALKRLLAETDPELV